MAQILLPFYPEGTTMINSSVGIKNIKDIGIVYFNEAGPFYKHHFDDYRSFRFITSQMMDLKQVRQIEVIRFFKISKESAKRWLRTYRSKGVTEFFKPQNTRKKGTILTSEIIQRIEAMLRRGLSVKEIGLDLGIKPDTIKKGIQDGRICLPTSTNAPTEGQKPIAKIQSQRSAQDSCSPIGMGCTNIEGRTNALKKK